MSRIRPLPLALLLAVIAPAPALAQNASVSTSGGRLIYAGSGGADNFFITVPNDGLNWLVQRNSTAAALIDATPPCEDLSPYDKTRVRCGITGGATVDLNGGDDFAGGGALGHGITFDGGAGDDLIVPSGGGGNTVVAGEGDDTTNLSDEGAATVDLGPGDDRAQYPRGADDIHGGAGVDLLELSTVTAMSVTLDGLANDGAAGLTKFNVHPDMEDVRSGEAADTLVGSAAANVLDAGAGADILDGGGGADTLRGGAGDDTIDARDGVADTVDCGVGADTATVDPADLPVSGCETVRLPDDDLDGVTAPQDCDDRDATIKPGAPDVPGDGVDQDCSGADAPLPAAPGPAPAPAPAPGPGSETATRAQPADVRNRWLAGPRRTKVAALEVRDAPTGAEVRVTCKGRGCAFSRRTATVGRDGKARLTARFEGRALAPGAVIEVRITAAGFYGKLVRYTVRKGKLPKSAVLCIRPGAAQPVAGC